MMLLTVSHVQQRIFVKVGRLNLVRPRARRDNFCRGFVGQDLQMTKPNVFPVPKVHFVLTEKLRSASNRALTAKS